jgi:hypothetical protein
MWLISPCCKDSEERGANLFHVVLRRVHDYVHCALYASYYAPSQSQRKETFGYVSKKHFFIIP